MKNKTSLLNSWHRITKIRNILKTGKILKYIQDIACNSRTKKMQVKGGTENFITEKQGSQRNPAITETTMAEMYDRKRKNRFPKEKGNDITQIPCLTPSHVLLFILLPGPHILG